MILSNIEWVNGQIHKIFCVQAGILGYVKLAEITKEDAYPFFWNNPSELYGINQSN